MKTAVVTGAFGFIGRVLTRKLLAEGWQVWAVVLDRKPMKELLLQEGLTCIEADFSIYSKLDRALPQADVFFHLAWAGGFEQEALKNYELQLSNAKYACDALTVAAKTGVGRFIYAATINEIEIQQFINTFAEFQTRPTCIYASAKLAGELMCRTLAQEKGIRYNAGLIPMIYGEGNYSKQVVNVVLTSLLEKKAPKLIPGKNLYDLVSVYDVADALIAIGEKGINGKRYYVGHRKLKTFKEWMEEMRDAVAPSVQLCFGEYKDPLDLDYSLIDLDALYKDTGFECRRDFKEGILRTAEWMKNPN